MLITLKMNSHGSMKMDTVVTIMLYPIKVETTFTSYYVTIVTTSSVSYEKKMIMTIGYISLLCISFTYIFCIPFCIP